MGYLIAYRHTGEAAEKLNKLIPPVNDALLRRGIEVYCTYFDEDAFTDSGWSPRAIMNHAFRKIDEMGGVFVVQDSTEKSEGVILEVGYCVAKGLPIVVAKRSTVTNTYLPEMADTSFEYSNIEELQKLIASHPKLG